MIKLIVTLLLFFPTALFAANITLKSGKKIEGKILEKTNQYIKIDSAGTPIYYELKYIDKIEEEKEIAALPEEVPALGDVNAYFKQGLKLGAEEKFGAAEEALKRGLAMDSAHYNSQEVLRILSDLKSGTISKEYAVYLFKGSDYLMNAQYQPAIAEFNQALKLKPDDSDLNYYLGVCHYFLEEYAQAISCLEKALAIKPSDEIYYYLGACNYSLGQYQEALAYLKKVLEARPEDAEVYALIGTSQYLLSQFQNARENLNKAKALFEKQGDYLKAKDLEDFLSKLD